MDIQELSGLEFMSGLQEGRISPGGMAQTVPMGIVEVTSGYARFSARADERHTNPFGGVHGGFAATVMDSVTACAVHTMLEAGIGFATLDLSTKMIKPVPLGEDLVAEGKVINLSKKIGIAEGTLRDAGGNLYAHATAIYMIRR
jgi:uncharacterized protein (TIGR00369 family)